MVNRKPFIVALAAIIVISWLVVDSRSSEAQLFRRLRQRIQSRAIPAQPQPNQSQTPAQPTVPRYGPQQRPEQSSVTPRRVAPVRPARPAGSDLEQIAPGKSESPQNDGQSSKRPQLGSDEQRFGQSLLQRGDDTPTNKASLGIQVVPSPQAIPGLTVTGFNPGSLASDAGLQVGDLIISMDGRPTTSAAEIGQLLSVRQGGERVRLRIVRNRRTSAIDVPLIGGTPSSAVSPVIASDSAKANPVPSAARPPKSSGGAKAFGLQYADIDGERGALVKAVEKGTPASESGLQIGDRIVAIDGRLLVNALALKQVLDQRPTGSAVDVRMVRDGKLLSAQLDFSQTAAKSFAADKVRSDDQQKKSALGGVGALLGGLLSGKPTTKAEPKDEMALGDDEGVRQVDFEAEIDAGDPDRSPDPLSLEALELPPNSEPTELVPPKSDDEKSAEQLRKEIVELKRKLKELEEKNK